MLKLFEETVLLFGGGGGGGGGGVVRLSMSIPLLFPAFFHEFLLAVFACLSLLLQLFSTPQKHRSCAAERCRSSSRLDQQLIEPPSVLPLLLDSNKIPWYHCTSTSRPRFTRTFTFAGNNHKESRE
jgi:hypothetical protein